MYILYIFQFISINFSLNAPPQILKIPLYVNLPLSLQIPSSTSDFKWTYFYETEKVHDFYFIYTPLYTSFHHGTPGVRGSNINPVANFSVNANEYEISDMEETQSPPEEPTNSRTKEEMDALIVKKKSKKLTTNKIISNIFNNTTKLI